MADFQTHITTSTVLGGVYGLAGYVQWDMPIPSCLVAAGLCSLAGVLPDVDSETSRPQREILSFAAAVIPLLMIDRFVHLGFTHEQMALAGGCIYVIVRFGLGRWLQLYTVHRGMWHSVPAVAIAGLAAWLVCSCSSSPVRVFKTAAVVIGYLTHLILDEMWAVQWRRGRLRFKKSFGTALKFFAPGRWANVSTYGKLALLAALAFSDPIVMERYDIQPNTIQRTAHDWLDKLLGHDHDQTLLR